MTVRCVGHNAVLQLSEWCSMLRSSFCTEASSSRGQSYFFFFQAEDGIRDLTVTGVQTCALPISAVHHLQLPCSRVSGDHGGDEVVAPEIARQAPLDPVDDGEEIGLVVGGLAEDSEIGRASCRERV